MNTNIPVFSFSIFFSKVLILSESNSEEWQTKNLYFLLAISSLKLCILSAVSRAKASISAAVQRVLDTFQHICQFDLFLIFTIL